MRHIFLAAAVALAMPVAAQAATVTFESAEADPKVQLVIDDAAVAGGFRFTLTTTFGVADFLGLGFDYAGTVIAQANLALVSYTPGTANTPALTLFGNNTNLQNTCGTGCNFNGAGSDPGPYDYIIRIGQNGGGPNEVSSAVFDIFVTGSLSDFSDFGIRAQGTSGPSSSIKFGLPPVSIVPLPAAGWALLLALGGLGLASRRRAA